MVQCLQPLDDFHLIHIFVNMPVSRISKNCFLKNKNKKKKKETKDEKDYTLFCFEFPIEFR